MTMRLRKGAVEYVVGNPLICCLREVDAVPAYTTGRRGAGGADDLAAVDDPSLATPDMNIMLMVSTTYLPRVVKSCMPQLHIKN